MTPGTAANWLDQGFQALWRDNERTLFRGVLPGGAAEGGAAEGAPVLLVVPTEWASDAVTHRLAHEHRLRAHLDPAWAIEPINLTNEGRVLVLRDPGGTLLARLGGAALGIERFLALASAVTDAVRAMHEHGVLHLDLQPSHVLVVPDAHGADAARLTGFGLGLRLAMRACRLRGWNGQRPASPTWRPNRPGA